MIRFRLPVLVLALVFLAGCGFHLRNAAAEREWNTPAAKATFFAGPLPEETVHQKANRGEGRYALQTFRSHDQYNTTVYGLDDRYRGVYGERQVIFMHPADLEALGAAPAPAE